MSKEAVRESWLGQVIEMHEKCKEYGESWAWEYLWKNWYNPNRWSLWARSACAELPITHSNAYVEALWSTFKKRYLRKYARPKMEFMVDILMNQYLANKVRLVRAHRSRKQVPDW